MQSKTRCSPRRCYLLWWVVAVCLWLAPGWLGAADKGKGKQPVALPAEKPATVRWFGHGFFQIISSTGIRVVFDPFERGVLPYPLPPKIMGDVVLITHESETMGTSASEQISGAPQVFRSTMAVGINRGSGLLFKGSKSFRNMDKGTIGGRNVMYSFKIDGVYFANLGALGHTLNTQEIADIGVVDVVIMPVGFCDLLTAKMALEVAAALKAKILVPSYYATAYTSGLKLGTVDAFLAEAPGVPVRRLESNQFGISPASLPEVMEIWVPAPPAPPTENPS